MKVTHERPKPFAGTVAEQTPELIQMRPDVRCYNLDSTRVVRLQ